MNSEIQQWVSLRYEPNNQPILPSHKGLNAMLKAFSQDYHDILYYKNAKEV